MSASPQHTAQEPINAEFENEDEGPQVSLVDLLT